MPSKKILVPGGVSEYISACPVDIQAKLEQVRSVIRNLTPDAIETVSYFQFPGYAYDEGYEYNGMFVWFSYKKPFIRLHVRPPTIKNHASELAKYKTTTGIISFPELDDVDTDLIKTMVEASLSIMKSTKPQA